MQHKLRYAKTLSNGIRSNNDKLLNLRFLFSVGLEPYLDFVQHLELRRELDVVHHAWDGDSRHQNVLSAPFFNRLLFVLFLMEFATVVITVNIECSIGSLVFTVFG